MVLSRSPKTIDSPGSGHGPQSMWLAGRALVAPREKAHAQAQQVKRAAAECLPQHQNIFVKAMMARSAIRGGMGFIGILLSRAASSASARPQPWGRVYATALGVRGGASSATAEAIGVDTAAAGSPGTSGPTSSPAATSDPFQHLPGIEVCCTTVGAVGEETEHAPLRLQQAQRDHSRTCYL